MLLIGAGDYPKIRAIAFWVDPWEPSLVLGEVMPIGVSRDKGVNWELLRFLFFECITLACRESIG